MNDDIAGLIRRIVEDGETAVYREVVDRFAEQAFGVAFSILGNREDARDITQDAFVKAYRALPSLRERSKFAPWLKRIVADLSKNSLRDGRRRRAAHTAAVQHAAEATEGPLARVEERETDDAVYGHIQALPERHRTVIIMKFLEGMRYEEIASFLGISPRSAKTLSLEAKRLLLVRLKKQGIATPATLRARNA